MQRIGVLVSGGGTNLQAILDAEKSGIIKSGKVSCVISNNSRAYALERAKNNNVPAYFVSRKEQGENFENEILRILKEEKIDVVVLAGFMCILGNTLIKAYPNRIVNVHPALIPSFCGEGFYGLHVHEKALEYGVKLTGATVHFVNEIADGGPIIMQKSVEIKEDDTPEILQKRVMTEAEHIILPKSVELLCAGKIEVSGRKVLIKE